MFKIGDFSKLARVSVRMLRYYDEQGLLKPSQVDSFTGYRFYSADQIPVIQRIVSLRDMGFLTAEIAGILSDPLSEEKLITRLERKVQEVEGVIAQEKEKLRKLESLIESLGMESMSMNLEVILKNVPSYKVVGLREVIPSYNQEGKLWYKISQFIEQNGISCTFPSFAIYHDKEYREADVDVEVVCAVDHLKESREGFVFRETEAVPTMASVMVKGPYDRIDSAFRSLAEWITRNEYQMTGASRQVCHKGPWNESNPEEYLTEIQIPVTK